MPVIAAWHKSKPRSCPLRSPWYFKWMNSKIMRPSLGNTRGLLRLPVELDNKTDSFTLTSSRLIGQTGRTSVVSPVWLLRHSKVWGSPPKERESNPTPVTTTACFLMPKQPTSLSARALVECPARGLECWSVSQKGESELIVERISPVMFPTWPATWWREREHHSDREERRTVDWSEARFLISADFK